MTTLGKRLIKAAKEARAIARGEADPASYRAHVPAEIDARTVRRKLGLSQEEFAARFAIPVATVRDWEQKRRRPEGPGRVLLTIIDRDPKAVERALASKVRRPAGSHAAGSTTRLAKRGGLPARQRAGRRSAG